MRVLQYFLSQTEATLTGFAFAYDLRSGALEFDRTDFSYDTARQLEKMIYIGDVAMEDRDDLVEVSTMTFITFKYKLRKHLLSTYITR